MKKRAVSGIAAATLSVIALAGCGTSGAASNTGSGTSTSGSSSANQVVQLSFWYGIGGQLSNDVQKMVSQFNAANPGIHVTATYQGSYSGGGPEQQKLLAALKAGDPPDLAQMEVNSMPVFSATGKLMALDTQLQQSTVDNPSNFIPGMWASTQYQGKTYAVPMNRSVPVLYYNETLFHKVGISGPPKTWADLQADAAKLTSGSGSGKVYGFGPLVDWWPWEASVWSGGGSILNSGLSKADFATPAGEHVLSIEQQIVKNGNGLVETGPNYWNLMTEDFIHGKIAMDIDSIGSSQEVNTGVRTSFKWNTALLPSDATLAVPPGGGNLAIMSGISPAHAAAAFKFVEWFTSPAQAAEWSELTGYLPVTKAALSEPGFQTYLKSHPFYNAALKELADQHPAPPSPNYLAVLQYVQQSLQGIMDEGKPVDASMKQAQSQANNLLG